MRLGREEVVNSLWHDTRPVVTRLCETLRNISSWTLPDCTSCSCDSERSGGLGGEGGGELLGPSRLHLVELSLGWGALRAGVLISSLCLSACAGAMIPKH